MHFKKKPIRFNEFMKSIKPISSKTLSSKLKELADFGVIKKEVLTDQTPVLVLYSLTEKGQQLTPILDTIAQWNLKWRTKNN
jgi:DNA-binding HxlR family transcriptional regulator